MSNITPDDGRPPRLIRLCSASELPAMDVIAELDQQTNVLRISREAYERADDMTRHRIEKTEDQFTYGDMVTL